MASQDKREIAKTVKMIQELYRSPHESQDEYPYMHVEDIFSQLDERLALAVDHNIKMDVDHYIHLTPLHLMQLWENEVGVRTIARWMSGWDYDHEDERNLMFLDRDHPVVGAAAKKYAKKKVLRARRHAEKKIETMGKRRDVVKGSTVYRNGRVMSHEEILDDDDDDDSFLEEEHGMGGNVRGEMSSISGEESDLGGLSNSEFGSEIEIQPDDVIDGEDDSSNSIKHMAMVRKNDIFVNNETGEASYASTHTRKSPIDYVFADEDIISDDENQKEQEELRKLLDEEDSDGLDLLRRVFSRAKMSTAEGAEEFDFNYQFDGVRQRARKDAQNATDSYLPTVEEIEKMPLSPGEMLTKETAEYAAKNLARNDPLIVGEAIAEHSKVTALERDHDMKQRLEEKYLPKLMDMVRDPNVSTQEVLDTIVQGLEHDKSLLTALGEKGIASEANSIPTPFDAGKEDDNDALNGGGSETMDTDDLAEPAQRAVEGFIDRLKHKTGRVVDVDVPTFPSRDKLDESTAMKEIHSADEDDEDLTERDYRRLEMMSNTIFENAPEYSTMEEDSEEWGDSQNSGDEDAGFATGNSDDAEEMEFISTEEESD